MLFVGIDWAERHHDVCLLDPDGQVLARARIAEGVEGLARLHALVASHSEEPARVMVGIETDRGLLVGALVAAGYQVYAINPLQASRYRERHGTSRAKSDRGDAQVLAELVRTDRHHHRQVAGDSSQAEAVKILARAHQRLVWTRQRQTNQLRSTLREFSPAALAALGAELASPQALAVLAAAPTPQQGRQLPQAELAELLARAGRQRNLHRRAAELQQALTSPQLATPAVLAAAYGQVVAATVGVLAELNQQINTLEQQLSRAFEAHPDAELLRSLPGLGVVLGARVLAEFGDDPTRYGHLKHLRPTRAPPPSPVPLAPARSSWPGWPATGVWPMPATCGPSAPFPVPQVPAPATTASAPAAPPTIRPCGPSATGWSASSMAASATAASTTSNAPGPTTPKQPPLDTYQPWDV